ncbi:hypothetical protein G9A89_018362 [Geosiphon pyriformis]|nr:hypothetical protein G9A89_018362 [Geosiphon pyriformis]
MSHLYTQRTHDTSTNFQPIGGLQGSRSDFSPWRDLNGQQHDESVEEHSDRISSKYLNKWPNGQEADPRIRSRIFSTIPPPYPVKMTSKFASPLIDGRIPAIETSYGLKASLYEKPQYIQFRIRSMSFGDYSCKSAESFPDGVGNLRYHYVKGSIGLFLNGNTIKILIPVEVIKSIYKEEWNIFSLELNEKSSSLIRTQIADGLAASNRIPQSIRNAKIIKMVVHENTPLQKIDMTRLHIQFEIENRNEASNHPKDNKAYTQPKERVQENGQIVTVNGEKQVKEDCQTWGATAKGKSENSGWSYIIDESLVDPAEQHTQDLEIKGNGEINFLENYTKNGKEVSNNTEKLLIKFHSSTLLSEDEIRILQFPINVTFDEVKSTIQETCVLPEIRKLKCKDDEGEMITITGQYDFATAVDFYAPRKKLELWLVQ